MTDMDLFFADARAADALAVAQKLGVRLKKIATNEYAGPCPSCGGADRFSVNVRKKIFNCRGCGAKGSNIDLVMLATDCTPIKACERITGRTRPNGASKDEQERTASAARAKAIKEIRERSLELDDPRAEHGKAYLAARRITRELVPLIGTPAETYLAQIRKIDVGALEDVLSRCDALGWHPSVYFNEPGHPLHAQRLGCIVGIMTDAVTAEPTGAISRTYLTPDLAKVGKAKTLGSPAGIVRLSEDADVLFGLHLAEGMETALTVMSKGLRPIWATGSTSLMRTFPILNVIEWLTLIVDHDANRAGEEAAREVETRWLLAGRKVRLRQPNQLGDFNDVVVGEAK